MRCKIQDGVYPFVQISFICRKTAAKASNWKAWIASESWTTKKVVFHSGNFSKMVHNGRLSSFNSWSWASVYLKPKWLVTELLDPDDLMEDWGYSGTVNNPRFTFLATWNACCTVYRLRAVSFSSDLVSVELSFACLARFARWAKKKERLLVVYTVNSRFLSLVSRPSKKAHLL